KVGRFCEALYLGSHAITRWFEVTWFRSPLFSTMKTSVGFAHRFQYFAAVTRPLMPFICIAPSPTMAITGRSGCTNFAAIAYGTPGPMVESPPDSEAIMPRRMRMSREYQFAAEPESQVRMARSGRRLERPQKT